MVKENKVKNSHKILQQRRKDVTYQFTTRSQTQKIIWVPTAKSFDLINLKSRCSVTFTLGLRFSYSKLFCGICSLICINQCKTYYLSREALSSSAAKCSSGKGILVEYIKKLSTVYQNYQVNFDKYSRERSARALLLCNWTKSNKCSIVPNPTIDDSNKIKLWLIHFVIDLSQNQVLTIFTILLFDTRTLTFGERSIKN